MNTSTPKYIALVFSVLLFIAAHLAGKYIDQREKDCQRISKTAGQNLTKLENDSRRILNKVAGELLTNIFPDESFGIAELEDDKVPWLSVFIFEGDSLLWWSDNSVLPVSNDLSPGLRLYQNGWYEYFVKESGPYVVAGLLKIKNQYAFQNRFLSNDFNPCLGISSTASLLTTSTEGSYPVIGLSDTPLFFIQYNDTANRHLIHGWIAAFYIIAFLLFLVSVYLITSRSSGFDLRAGLITLFAIIVSRVLSIYYNYPPAIFELPMFSPSYYASSFLLNSLGDLLITSVLLAYLVGVLFRMPLFETVISGRLHNNMRLLIASVLILFTFLYSVFINHLLAGLIINSRISFNINNVFELNVYSLVGVVVIGILLFSFYLVCEGIVRIITKILFEASKQLVVFILAIVVFIFVFYVFRQDPLFSEYSISVFLLTTFLLIYIGYIRQNKENFYAFTRFLLIIFGFSIYAAYTISDFNKQREKENRKLLAVKLENEQDQVAEYLFDDIATKVAQDKVITRFFASSYEELLSTIAATDVIEKRMSQYYFTGYWGKYDITIKCFNSEGLPVNTGGDPSWNLDYYNILIQEDGRPTGSPYLFFAGNTSGRISYIGRIPVYSPDNASVQTGTIVINLVSKALQDEGGFPELLLSDKVPQKRDISNYSYAHYRNSHLVNQFGNYNYLVSSKPYREWVERGVTSQFVNFDEHSHLFYSTGDKSLMIISIRNPGVLEFITLFSYLFSFYAICFILIYSSLALWKGRGRISINFKNRIQATVIVIVVTTMLLIGGATVYYIFRNYVTNINITVNDRLKSMLIAIQDELSTRSLRESEISDEMNYSFSKLASTLSIDFNIFSKEGMLVYSTQPKIYEQGLIARIMNRDAITNLAVKNKSLHIQFEEIGKLKFLSAYEPVRNNNNQTIGYVNLPYFAKQDELKKDISSFLVALINIYVLLFAFSIFITFMISSRITKPLQLIQQRLGKIRLGKRNELIEWGHDDEIGALVKEYNRMVEELAESAEMLARSERDSAWREMAKQVAHEIKNPLTPMKLSVQHLQRAWKEQSPNIDGIMQRFSQTLIEQIDTLSNIATEFSNFAKMPKANNEATDLSAILRSTISLYSGNESATITYYEHRNGKFMVFGDKEQLMRVFSNLFKNAIQAIPENVKGHIHVELKKSGSTIIASVNDNGRGISEEEKNSIFIPNFTTKTGGMGLGLAMAKDMIEHAGGKIWFDSTPGEGTVFYISLPEFWEE